MSFTCGFISTFGPLVYKGYRDLEEYKKGDSMSGHSLPYRKSQGIFTRGAVKQKTINTNVNVMRGGIRL